MNNNLLSKAQKIGIPSQFSWDIAQLLTPNSLVHVSIMTILEDHVLMPSEGEK